MKKKAVLNLMQILFAGGKHVHRNEIAITRATLLHNISCLMYFEGRLSKIEELSKRVVEIREGGVGLLDKEHPGTLSSMCNLPSINLPVSRMTRGSRRAI